MKILVIRFSAIGDIVLATPAIRCLRKRYPDAEIHFLTKKSFAAVTEANPYINRFHYYDNNLPEIIATLKPVGFDHVVDLQNNVRSWRVKRALNAKNHTIDKLNVQKFLLVNLRMDRMPGRHITQRSLDVVRQLGAQDDGLGLDYFVPDKDVVPWDSLPATHRNGYVAVVIGASYPTKKMPVHKLRDLCGEITWPVVLLGGPEEKADGEQIATVDPQRIFNACGRFNLNQSADLVRKARMVVSHDTGLQYVASAFGKPTLAVWGSTSPKLDVEPYYGSAFVNASESPIYENILVPGLPCQPCSKFGNRRCPQGHFRCMEDQDTTAIAANVNRRMQGPPPTPSEGGEKPPPGLPRRGRS
ncbi:MAG: glycosyltransferase family 9 protein [Cytophagales bacterium]|nr:glycosyltransferase family 9 protein [Cytophagales bacterium]